MLKGVKRCKKMCDYHWECIKYGNGCKESHCDYIEDGHFWRIGNIIGIHENGLYKNGGF